jgi:peptide/nickel transport system substrate-binding protein
LSVGAAGSSRPVAPYGAKRAVPKKPRAITQGEETAMTMEFDRRQVMIGAGALAMASPTLAEAQEYISKLPRAETLIIENPEGTIRNPSWFNYWTPGGGGWSTGLHQLALDTLWFIDPEKGIDGAWDNSLASEKPVYNADFTEMTVKLRKGIFWSDGVEFSAADLVYTVETLMKNPGMPSSAVMTLMVDKVSSPDSSTVVFKLKSPNSRFHAQFTVRWNAIMIMPKHIFEKVADPTKYDFNPPVSIGPYTLKSFDTNGAWYIWERREDWKRTTLGRFGQPGPKYVTYVDPGPSEKRVIAQTNHNLDIIHDMTPEGMLTLMRESKSSVAWFKGFPYAHPDPTLPAIIFNNQIEKLKSQELRWALALAMDIKAISMASYRGLATISAIAMPPTGVAMDVYHKGMQDWLKSFELDTGKSKVKPYDQKVTVEIADQLRATMKDAVPKDASDIANAFGYGWWRTNHKAAGELLEKAGYTKKGKAWVGADGKPLSIALRCESNARSVFTRAASQIVEQWKNFGIDAKLLPSQHMWDDDLPSGNFEAALAWSIETWGGDTDLSFFITTWAKKFVQDPGKYQTPRNWQRWSHPELDTIIDKIQSSSFDDPKGVDYGMDFLKLMVREMPIIPLMSYNVFTAMDTTYWTGYPSHEDPYTNPVPNWANSKYMMPKLKPTKA